MANKIYKGKAIRLTVGGHKVFHATTCGVSATRNFEDLVSKDTDGTETTPSDYTWTANLSAFVAERDPVTSEYYNFMDVVQAFIDGDPVVLEYTTDETGDFVLGGNAYIESFNITAEAEGVATGDFSFRGNGTLNVGTVPA